MEFSGGCVRRGNGTTARAAFAVTAGILVLFSLVACSGDFGSCVESKTCPHKPDGAVSAGGGSGNGGQSVAGTGGGVTSGGTGGGGVSTGGSSASGGTSVEAGTDSGEGVLDGGAHDAQVVPGCSSVDGGIMSDPDHCGSCSTVCSAAGTALTGRVCVAGACKPTCDATHQDCNKNGADGCEVDFKTDPDHCGACTTACSAVGTAAAGRICLAGLCKPTCDTAHQDCNKNGADGCEIDFKTDPDHCGSCTTVCAATGTSARQCVNGLCTPTCDATHSDCNKNGVDGCEVDLTTNADNCGACGYACAGATAQVTQRRCVARACAPVCVNGYGDCSRSAAAPDNGCETNLSATSDCGSCKHDCLGGQCSAFACQEVVIASGLEAPKSLTVTDSSYVYWVDGGAADGRVMRNSIFGGTVPPPIETAQALPYDIENDGTYVYWTNIGAATAGVFRVNITGTPTALGIATSTLFSVVKSPGALAVDSQYVYWGDGVSDRIYRMLKTGAGSPVDLNKATLPSFPTDVVVDSNLAYFAYFGASETWAVLPTDGSTAAQTYAGPTATSVLAVDGTSLFYRYHDATSGKFGFAKIPRGSVASAQATIVAGAVDPSDNAFTVDATHLYYWSDALYSIPKAGGSPKLLSGNVDNVVKIVVHAEGGGQAIYWVNQGNASGSTGSIRKLAL